jgi:uncharacterized membrane protein YecN with MAPEG domain
LGEASRVISMPVQTWEDIMTATLPTITPIYAAVLGILGAWLTINVIVNRVRAKVDAGDGGVAKLAQAIRAHANFAEQAPMGLIVIAFAESVGTRALFIHILCVALVVARLASAYALNRTLNQSPPRQFSASISVLTLVLASAAILAAAVGVP